MNKITLATAIVIAATGTALAQTNYYYGNNGYSGYSNRVGNSTYYYDNQGNSGYSNTIGNTTYYNGNNGQSGYVIRNR